MALSLQESGKTSLDHARKASQEIQEGNIGSAKLALAKVETSTGMHLKEIEYLIERYSVVQDYYKQHERELTANINSVLEKEQSLENQKSAAATQLRSERAELSKNRSELSYAEGRLNDAQRKRRNANTGKVITWVSAGLLTLVTFATLGAAAPVTVPLAVGAVGGAVAFDQVEKDAQKDIERCRSRINDTQRKIGQIESNISSLSSKISTLNSQKSRYLDQRSCLQEEKGKMKKVIVFLQDAQIYGSQYSLEAKHCIDRTAHTGNLISRAETKGYSLFDSRGTERVLNSFDKAWDAFEKMNENGNSYNFKMDFQCTRCNSSYQQLPHVNSGQLICSDCHDAMKY